MLRFGKKSAYFSMTLHSLGKKIQYSAVVRAGKNSARKFLGEFRTLDYSATKRIQEKQKLFYTDYCARSR